MRILHFYKTYFPDTVGGVEQVIYQLARSTRSLGVQTDVLSLSAKQYFSPSIQFDGHQVHRVKMNFQVASTGFSLSAFSRFAQLCQHVDLIHYHYPWPFMDLVHFATRVNIPTVVTYHSDIVKQKRLFKCYMPLCKRFLSSVSQIVATSPNYMETSPVLATYRDKTVVIPIGLDQSTYPEPSAALLDRWRKQIGGRFFLFVGVLRYYKGLSVLLEALREIDFPMVIVGSGPLELELKKQASQLGLKNILFLGHLGDLDKVALLTLCYAAVFPSHLRSEAFGISLLEGAMYGKPMISSEIGTGTSYINIDQETGLVVPPADPFALRQALCFLWDNPDVAALMGKQAEKRYWEVFTAEKMAREYVEVYRNLLERV